MLDFKSVFEGLYSTENGAKCVIACSSFQINNCQVIRHTKKVVDDKDNRDKYTFSYG